MTSSEHGEREQALKALLSKSLADFQGGQGSLPQLVHDVENLIDSIEEVSDAHWVKELRGNWAQLEIVYALMLDEDRSELGAEEKHDVDAAVRRLRATLKSASGQE